MRLTVTNHVVRCDCEDCSAEVKMPTDNPGMYPDGWYVVQLKVLKTPTKEWNFCSLGCLAAWSEGSLAVERLGDFRRSDYPDDLPF